MKRKVYIAAMKELVSRKAFPVTFLILIVYGILFPGVSMQGGFQLKYYDTVSNLITGPETYVVILAMVMIPGAVARIYRNQFYDVEKITQMRPGTYLLFRILGYATVLWGCWHVFPVCALANWVSNKYKFGLFKGIGADLWMRIFFGEFLMIIPSCLLIATLATAVTLLLRRSLPTVLVFSAWVAGDFFMYYLEKFPFTKYVYTRQFFWKFFLNYKCPVRLQTELRAIKIYTVPHLLGWSGYLLLAAAIAFAVGYIVLKKRDMNRI